jgi:TolB-like protein
VASQALRPVAAKAAMPMDVGLANAPRLSAVVLPFNNLGGEGVDEETVDGVTEDLTTDLSRLPGLLVIARNSAFTYKGKSIDVKRVGEELGVRYAWKAVCAESTARCASTCSLLRPRPARTFGRNGSMFGATESATAWTILCGTSHLP